jgi:putative acetyltransferase
MPLPEKFNIRTAVNEDSDEIKALISGILDEYQLSYDPQSTDRDLDNIEDSYANNFGIFDVVVNPDGTIIASTGLFRVNKTTCELRKMYLLKEYRGMGLGKFLLDHSIGAAERLGYKKIVLETASVLKEAIGLYEKYGFKKYEPEHLSSRCDQTYFLSIEKEN